MFEYILIVVLLIFLTIYIVDSFIKDPILTQKRTRKISPKSKNSNLVKGIENTSKNIHK